MCGLAHVIFLILTGSSNRTDSKGGRKYFEGISNGNEAKS
jgi:hypothetical protein